MHEITLGDRKLVVLRQDDPYARHLLDCYVQESAKLRNFVFTHFSGLKNGVFADVGANIGFTSLLMSEISRSAVIHAFEPSKDVYELLLKNISGANRIRAFNLAVSDQKARLGFSSNSAYGHIELSAGKCEEGIDAVDLFSHAETEGISKFDFVKIDVEGFELSVFRGLNDVTDVVYFEYNPWCIVAHYRGNPLEVLEEIMQDWLIYRFADDVTLELIDSPHRLAHDTIVYKALDDFVAVRKSAADYVVLKTRLSEHFLGEQSAMCGDVDSPMKNMIKLKIKSKLKSALRAFKKLARSGREFLLLGSREFRS